MAERGREPGWSLLLNPTPRVIEELGYPSAETLRTDVRQRERAAALAFTAQQEETFAADVVVLAGEVEVLEAAGGRSPAAMYRVPEEALGQLDDEAGAAVIRVRVRCRGCGRGAGRSRGGCCAGWRCGSGR